MTDKAMAVVIGHGPGVGEACARAFAAQRRPVALIARDGARAAAAAAALSREAGVPAAGLAADAGDEAALLAALEAAQGALGPPGVVLHNAARWRPGPVLAIAAAEVEADWRTCVVGAWTAARWAAPLMAGAGGGAILLTGGGLALRPSAEAPTLSLGKAGIRALALMLADELAPQGIRVGTVTVAGIVDGPVGAGGIPAARVAQAFLDLAAGAPGRATAETVLRP